MCISYLEIIKVNSRITHGKKCAKPPEFSADIDKPLPALADSLFATNFSAAGNLQFGRLLLLFQQPINYAASWHTLF